MKKENFKMELTVGEVSQRAGIAVSAIHFYEQKGLISSRRNSGNQRRFQRDVLRRVSIIKVAQKLGIPLKSIQKAFKGLPKTDLASNDDWKVMSKPWKVELEERIEQLTLLKNQLNHCIGCGCLSIKDCPLRNPWDVLSEEGAGPRLLE